MVSRSKSVFKPFSFSQTVSDYDWPLLFVTPIRNKYLFFFLLFIQQCVCKVELARDEWVCELPHKRGDGFCDPSNNYDHCGFDGGDCCNNNNEGWDQRCEVPWYQGVSY